jgi:hypothetical protein
LDPRFAGSNPAESDGVFKGDKIPQYDFLQSGNKAINPMSYDFKARNETLEV